MSGAKREDDLARIQLTSAWNIRLLAVIGGRMGKHVSDTSRKRRLPGLPTGTAKSDGGDHYDGAAVVAADDDDSVGGGGEDDDDNVDGEDDDDDDDHAYFDYFDNFRIWMTLMILRILRRRRRTTTTEKNTLTNVMVTRCAEKVLI